MEVLTESQNHLGWKSPSKAYSPTIPPALPSLPLNDPPKCHIYVLVSVRTGFIFYSSQEEEMARLLLFDIISHHGSNPVCVNNLCGIFCY